MPRINDESGRLTLATAPTGSRLVVLRLSTAADLTRRLGTLGLRPGAHVEILHASSGGGRVIGIAGSRLALGRDVLTAVEAEEVTA